MLRAETAGREVGLVAAIDDLREPEGTLARSLGDLPVSVHLSAPGSTIAEVRGTMLAAGSRAEAEVLVFLDADDEIETGALGRHLGALARADISFGDARPIDEEGRPLGPTLFEGIDVPAVVSSSDPVTRRNFLGLSNTAMRRDRLTATALHPPRANDATDWWLFTTLLDAGRTARRADGVVVRYRKHGANLLGSTPATTPASLLKRCRMALAHFAALPTTDKRRAAQIELRKLEAALLHGDPRLGEGFPDEKSLWFEDVFAAAAGIADGRGSEG